MLAVCTEAVSVAVVLAWVLLSARQDLSEGSGLVPSAWTTWRGHDFVLFSTNPVARVKDQSTSVGGSDTHGGWGASPAAPASAELAPFPIIYPTDSPQVISFPSLCSQMS